MGRQTETETDSLEWRIITSVHLSYLLTAVTEINNPMSCTPTDGASSRGE